MATDSTHITNNEKPSALAQFKLGYELNETWADAKRDVRRRSE